MIPEISGKLTPLGNVTTEVNRETNHVTVTLRPRDGVSIRHSVVEADGCVSLELWEGGRVPKPGEEVVVGDGPEKTTIEVTKAEKDLVNGWYWVYGDNGKKYRWE